MLWLVLRVVDQYCIRRILIHDPPPRSCYICWSITTSTLRVHILPPSLLGFSQGQEFVLLRNYKFAKNNFVIILVLTIEKAVHFSSLGLFETTYEEKDWISLTGLLLVCVCIYPIQAMRAIWFGWPYGCHDFFRDTLQDTHPGHTTLLQCVFYGALDIFTLC